MERANLIRGVLCAVLTAAVLLLCACGASGSGSLSEHAADMTTTVQTETQTETATAVTEYRKHVPYVGLGVCWQRRQTDLRVLDFGGIP